MQTVQINWFIHTCDHVPTMNWQSDKKEQMQRDTQRSPHHHSTSENNLGVKRKYANEQI